MCIGVDLITFISVILVYKKFKFTKKINAHSGFNFIFGWYWGKMRKLKKENSISEKMWDFCRGISITLFYPAHNAALIIFQAGSYFTQTNIIKKTKLSFLLKNILFFNFILINAIPSSLCNAMQWNKPNDKKLELKRRETFCWEIFSIQNGFLIKVSPATSFSTF